MSSSKLKKYCGILKYLESHDPHLYGAITDLCLDRIFYPSRGNGITFLYPPKDSPVNKEILEHTYSDNAEEAVKMIQGLVLRQYYSTPEDLCSSSKSGHVSNSLGFTVTHIEDSKVSLEPKFRGLSESIVSLFKYTGKPPTSGEKHMHTKHNSKMGGSIYGGGDRNRKLLQDVKEKLHGNQLGRLVEMSTSYLSYLITNHSEKAESLYMAGRIFKSPYVTFFTALDLNCSDDDEIVAKWIEKSKVLDHGHISKKPEIFEEYFDKYCEIATRVNKSHKSKLLEMDKEKYKMQMELLSNTISASDTIKKYKEIHPKLHDICKDRIKYDEIAFLVTLITYDLHHTNDNHEVFKEMFNIYESLCSADEECKLSILQEPLIKTTIGELSGIDLFCRSEFIFGPFLCKKVDPGTLDHSKVHNPTLIDQMETINMWGSLVESGHLKEKAKYNKVDIKELLSAYAMN